MSDTDTNTDADTDTDTDNDTDTDTDTIRMALRLGSPTTTSTPTGNDFTPISTSGWTPARRQEQIDKHKTKKKLKTIPFNT